VYTPLKVWTDEDIRAELVVLSKINSVPNNTRIDFRDYPKILGVHLKNNLTLVERYYCSDVCPQYGGVILIYENLSQNNCTEIGGSILIDPAWKGYKGCEPSITLTD
jgi:hypothetical protein